MKAFRLVSGGRNVGQILATDHDDAVTAFVTGRDLPDGVEVRAYLIVSIDRRPRAKRGYRA